MCIGARRRYGVARVRVANRLTAPSVSDLKAGSLFDLLHPAVARPRPLRLPLARVLGYACGVASGLAFLHAHRVMHRALKSSNVLLSPHDGIQVTDWGLTRRVGAWEEAAVAASGAFRWMAPELLRRQRFDQRIDVFSFAMLTWEMLTGELPYAHLSPPHAIAAVVDGGRPPVPESCPPRLTALLRTCWDARPGSRPSFAALVGALEGMYAEAVAPQPSPAADGGNRSRSPSGAVSGSLSLSMPEDGEEGEEGGGTDRRHSGGGRLSGARGEESPGLNRSRRPSFLRRLSQAGGGGGGDECGGSAASPGPQLSRHSAVGGSGSFGFVGSFLRLSADMLPSSGSSAAAAAARDAAAAARDDADEESGGGCSGGGGGGDDARRAAAEAELRRERAGREAEYWRAAGGGGDGGGAGAGAGGGRHARTRSAGGTPRVSSTTLAGGGGSSSELRVSLESALRADFSGGGDAPAPQPPHGRAFFANHTHSGGTAFGGGGAAAPAQQPGRRRSGASEPSDDDAYLHPTVGHDAGGGAGGGTGDVTPGFWRRMARSAGGGATHGGDGRDGPQSPV